MSIWLKSNHTRKRSLNTHLLLTRGEGHKRNQHLFEADASVLESACVEFDEFVISVGISEEVVVGGEDIFRRERGDWESALRRIGQRENLAGIVG